MLMKQKWFPRPHNLQHSWVHDIESGVVNQATIYPIVIHDEGLGTPSRS